MTRVRCATCFVQPNRTGTSKVDAPPCVVRPLPWSFVSGCARIIQASPLREWARCLERPSSASHLSPLDEPPVSVTVGVCTCDDLSKPKAAGTGGFRRHSEDHGILWCVLVFSSRQCVSDLGSQLCKTRRGVNHTRRVDQWKCSRSRMRDR